MRMVTLKKLYADRGIPQFYKGLAPVFIQGPLAWFRDTAANTGTKAALDSFELTVDMLIAAMYISRGNRYVRKPISLFFRV